MLPRGRSIHMAAERDRIASTQGGLCKKCSKTLVRDECHLDHVIPKNVCEKLDMCAHKEINKQTICADCHCSKTKYDETFRRVFTKMMEAHRVRPARRPAGHTRSMKIQRRYVSGNTRYQVRLLTKKPLSRSRAA